MAPAPGSHPVVLGLDVGTSGLTALAVSQSGAVVARAGADYSLSAPHPGWAEQHPEQWWDAARQALEQLRLAPGAVAAIAVSGQMHSAVLLDQGGQVIRPALLWCDTRTGPECAWLTQRLGLDGLAARVQNRALEGFTLPKLLWLRQHEPEHWARLRHLLLPKDYLGYRLTGALATDVSDASGTLLYDVAHNRWCDALFAELDLPGELVPPVHESPAQAGRCSGEAARALGLEGVPLAAGGADNACAALGSGVIEPGQVLVSIGTSGTVVAPTRDTTHIDPAMRLHFFRHAVPGLCYQMGVMLSAGGSLRWYRDSLLGRADLALPGDAGEALGYDRLLEPLAAGPTQPDDPFFLPYLAGERTPHADPAARGALVGLALAHDRAAVTRAVIEGISFGLADSLDLVRALGTAPSEVRVTGGGSRSLPWMRWLASILGATVVPMTAEGPAWGAAMLAAVAAGWFADPAQAARAWTARTLAAAPRVDPEPAWLPGFAERHQRFRALYPALRDVTRAAQP